MKISIICVGKIKKSYLKEFVEDYKKRVSKYSRVEIIEIKDVELKDNSELGILKVLEEEGRNIEKHLSASSYIICLAIEGKEVSSNQLAKILEGGFNKNANISFVIGGSYGISDEIKKKSDLRISFSKMTFPHQMMRGILLEQVYRSFKINNNESYHK